MRRFVVRFLTTALGIALAAYFVPGIRIDTYTTLLFAAFLLGIVNAFVKPVLVILTLPVTIITLGLFLFIINAFMLALVAALLPGFVVETFGSALMGWIIVSITSWLIISK